jgi:hypothetical protein
VKPAVRNRKGRAVRWTAAAVAVALVMAACSSAGNSTSATRSPAQLQTTSVTASQASAASPTPFATLGVTIPPIPLPSNACGGFHLKIVNAESGKITATVNGTYSLTIRAGSSETLVAFLPPEKPPLPWDVVLSDSTGSEIGAQSFTGPVDQKVAVSNGQGNSAPYDISQEGCH